MLGNQLGATIDDLLEKLKTLTDLKNAGTLDNEEFSFIKQQLIMPLQDKLSGINQQQHNLNTNALAASFRLLAIESDLSNFVGLIKDIQSDKTLTLDQEARNSIEVMIKEFDRLIHQMTQSLLSFYEMEVYHAP